MSIRKKLLDEISLEIEKRAEQIIEKGLTVDLVKSANEALIDSFLGMPRIYPNEKRATEHFLNKLERL